MSLKSFRQLLTMEARWQQKVLSYLAWCAGDRNHATDSPHTHITEGAD